MTFRPIAAVAIMALMTAGCGAQLRTVNTGPTQTLRVSIPYPELIEDVWRVSLTPGAARVRVTPGEEGIVMGRVDYNFEPIMPVLTTGPRTVDLRQGNFVGTTPANLQNEWTLNLGKRVPMNLIVREGAADSDWELGGVPLRDVDWAVGAADTEIRFGAPNPQAMERLKFASGAARARLRGLANANFGEARISAGAGELTLAFDGKLTRSAQVILDGGASSLIIESAGTPIRVVVDGGLTSVRSEGWTRSGDTYDSPGRAGASGPTVTIRATLGVSSLRLR
jgi:hypothetical protein